MVTACINLAELWSPKDIFYAALSAVIGVLIGLCLSEWQARRTKLEQIARLKHDLLSVFQFNVDRIHDAINEIKNSRIPNFLLDDLSVTHILYSGRELFESKQEFDDFNWQRFQIQHLNVKLTSALVAAKSDTGLALLELSSLVQHLEGTARNIQALLEKTQKANL